MIKYLKRSDYRNMYVIGDIHGHFELVRKRLDEIGFDPEQDALVTCGDLVDRGPDSDKVLDWLAYPWFFSSKGNHEQLHIDATDPSSFWYERSKIVSRSNGGLWFDDQPPLIQDKIIEAFKELPTLIEIETSKGLVGIVHGEAIHHDWALTKQAVLNVDQPSLDKMLWNRSKFKRRDFSSVEGLYKLFVGHTIIESSITLGNVTYTDHGIWVYNKVKLYKVD